MSNQLLKIGLFSCWEIVFFLIFPQKSTGSNLKNYHRNLDKHHHHSLIAQTDQPNQDRFIHPDIKPLPPQDEQILPQQEANPTIPDSNIEDKNTNIFVKKVEFTGKSIFSEQELQESIKHLEGRSVTLKELKDAALSITKKYVEQNYLTSRAILPPQQVKDGVVVIRLIEGSIADIKIKGNQRVKDSYIRNRLNLGIDETKPVRVDLIEGQLQLLRSNSLINNITANLQAAKGEGQSDLVVEIEEASPWLIGLNIDDYDTVATGAEKVGITLGYLNLTGNSDSLNVSFDKALSTESWSVDTTYNLPVNAKEGTLQLRANVDRNEIVGDEFEDLELEGDSELYEISFRQPLTRSLQKEIALSLGFSFQESRDFINGIRFTGTDRTNVLRFGQDFTSRGLKGTWLLRSQFNLGIDIFNTTVSDNEDEADGVFFSWFGQIQRIQRITKNNLLIVQGDLQLTPDRLLPSEQFVIGGVQSVRGFRQNARIGDNGFRLSIEDRITLVRNQEDDPVFQLAPFADLGIVWNTSSDNPDENFLGGIGLGLIAEPLSGFNIRLDYAPPLIDLDDTEDNLQEDGFYFRISYLN